ncbi:NADH-quinone oxidoreductase subunit NuoE [uncultured Desulfosarcina sp.]|uniref:NADH-quinone oxidoreductase subunit NuoE n=1 Tax=uncultured Desulfosarcina sp. TaxID=218289 RepID=UPI0029C75ADD|nr:NADH-quinone oxidoreductase subunit NuoE [uncultured Desulfosarcina sp.]
MTTNHTLTDEDRANLQSLQAQIETSPGGRGQLIPLLQKAQKTLSYLPDEALALVADHLKITRSEVYGVASFYNQFRFNPPGRNPVKVCMGTACHVRGGEIILENFERKLEIKEGETTEDREFSIERVACVGCCALAPVALVGETLHGHMAPSKVEGLVLRVRVEKEKAEREAAKL